MTAIVAYELSGMTDSTALGAVLDELRPAVACLLGVRNVRRLRSALGQAGLEVVARGGPRGAVNAIALSEGGRVRSVNRLPLRTPKGTPEREAVHAIVGVEGLALSVTALQLGLRADLRQQHVDTLLGFLASIEPPVVVGASLSEPASGPAASALGAAYTDAFAVAGTGPGETYPVDEPVARHDFVFVDHRLRVRRARVPSDEAVLAAARHRPVVVDIERVDEDGA
jgi:endonuclease/exonuclease/phosphatase family metal-dependent hydrolase